jgi:diguanylate cyclase (GGDEF)-like protein/PAS domain S-box-containing protein
LNTPDRTPTKKARGRPAPPRTGSAPPPEPERIGERALRDASFALTTTGEIYSWSAAAATLFGYEESEILGRSCDVLFAPEERDAGRLEAELRAVLESGSAALEGRRVRKDGTTFWCAETAVLLRSPAGSNFGVAIVCRDASALHAAFEELRRSEARLSLLLEGVADYALFSVDASGRIGIWNAGAERVFGYRESDVRGKHFSILYAPEEIGGRAPQLAIAAANGNGRAAADGWRVRKNGERFYAAGQMTRLPADAAGEPSGFVTSARDVTAGAVSEGTLEGRAFYDRLTQLPNRSFFVDCLRRALDCLKHDARERFAVIFLDLDRFKLFNDTFGHAAADALLVAIARILERCARPGDIVARLGGDEFTILMGGLASAMDAELVAQRIGAALAEPIHLDGFAAFASASMGIAVVSGEYENPDLVLRDADTAMYEAKSRGRGRHVVFDATMRARAESALRRHMDLRRAVERREFFLEYEAVVALGSRRAVAFEARVRWNHPERGPIAAPDFAAEAQSSDLVARIERWALREACRQLHEWHARCGDRALAVHVALSDAAFLDDALVLLLGETLDGHGLRPHHLRLAVAETALCGGRDATVRTFERIGRMGVDLYVNDYGRGRSSLAELADFPISALEIGPAFVTGSSRQTVSAEVPRAIVTLAHHLGLRAMAGGIETEEQCLRFQELGCEEGRGPWFAAPCGAADTARLIGVELPV